MDKFNLEHQYQFFLNKIGLKEKDMHPVQKVQLKETFFGACGVLLILFRDEITKLEEDDAVSVMQDMIEQVANYFLKANGQQN